MLRPERRIGLWAAATLWLIAHALFHFWEVAVGLCAPSVIPRDFPAVTLPALIGIALTLWAIRRARAGRDKIRGDRGRGRTCNSDRRHRRGSRRPERGDGRAR